MDYESRYCDRCQHGPKKGEYNSCPIMRAHDLKNYEDCNDKDSTLHILIPRDADGFNEQCAMFLPPADPLANHPQLPL